MPDSNLAVHVAIDFEATHTHIADDAGTRVCVDHETASTPFVLALRAAGAAC